MTSSAPSRRSRMLQIVDGDMPLLADGRPEACPRRDGELGPRACRFEDRCRYHVLHAARQRRPPAPERVTAALELADECSLDAAARTGTGVAVRGRKGLMSYRQIGLRLGLSRQRVAIIADIALRKYAAGMGLTMRPGALASLLVPRRRR